MNQEKSESQNKILKIFGNPIIGITGSIASILGIVLSIYFYFSSIATPELTYLVHPVKAAVFRTDQSSRFTVNYDNKPIDGDITAAQIAIWNDGNRPIRENEILYPLIIKTEDGTSILEAKIRKTSREVVEMKLDTSKADSGEVKVLWNIMEQGDGGIIQLIYKGNEKLAIVASAVVEGQVKIKTQKYQYSPKSLEEEKRVERILKYGGLFAIIATILIVIDMWRRIPNTQLVTSAKRMSRIKLFMLILSITTIIAYVIVISMTTQPSLPFNF